MQYVVRVTTDLRPTLWPKVPTPHCVLVLFIQNYNTFWLFANSCLSEVTVLHQMFNFRCSIQDFADTGIISKYIDSELLKQILMCLFLQFDIESVNIDFEIIL